MRRRNGNRTGSGFFGHLGGHVELERSFTLHTFRIVSDSTRYSHQIADGNRLLRSLVDTDITRSVADNEALRTDTYNRSLFDGVAAGGSNLTDLRSGGLHFEKRLGHTFQVVSIAGRDIAQVVIDGDTAFDIARIIGNLDCRSPIFGIGTERQRERLAGTGQECMICIAGADIVIFLPDDVSCRLRINLHVLRLIFCQFGNILDSNGCRRIVVRIQNRNCRIGCCIREIHLIRPGIGLLRTAFKLELDDIAHLGNSIRSFQTNEQTGTRFSRVVGDHERLVIDIITGNVRNNDTCNNHRLRNFGCRIRESQFVADFLYIGRNSRRTGTVLLNSDRGRLGNGNTLETAVRKQFSGNLTLVGACGTLPRIYGESQRRFTLAARLPAGMAPGGSRLVVESQCPTAGRNDLDGIGSPTVEFHGDSSRSLAVHGDRRKSAFIVLVIVRAGAEGSDRQRRAEQCFP